MSYENVKKFIDVISQEKIFVVARLSFCGYNIQTMDDWKNNILNLKECIDYGFGSFCFVIEKERLDNFISDIIFRFSDLNSANMTSTLKILAEIAE